MKKIRKWKDFLLEYNNIDALRYYIFDVDDNLLFMKTPLHFQHFEDGKWINKNIMSAEFAQIRKNYPDNYMDNNEWKGDTKYSFIEFRDFGPRGPNAFIEDVKLSIKDKQFGPSWETFINILKEGRLFAIVTTRGHEPSTLRSAVRYIIENILTPEDQEKMNKNLQNFNEMFGVIPTGDLVTQYLHECYFIGLFSQAFQDEFHYDPGPKLNQGKQDAINKFVNFVRGFSERTKIPLKVGFSDDDINFTKSAKELFMSYEKTLNFSENFYVFDTSNPKLKGGVKVKI